MKKTTGIFLVVAGLLLGPAHYIYERFYSGQVVFTQPLLVSPLQHAYSFAPVDLKLSAALQTVGFIFRLNAAHGPTHPNQTPRIDYRARLLEGERLVLDHRFSFQSSSIESTPSNPYLHAMPLLRVERGGQYRLEITQEGEASMNVLSADVQMRANMREPDMRWVTAGVMMLVIGAVILLR